MANFNQLNMSKIQAIQLERKSTVFDVCEEVRLQIQADNASIFHLINSKEKNLNYLVVDDEHRLLYCFVPKVASTNWLKFLVS
jgi:chondroitin 4-sulfotransferase 11